MGGENHERKSQCPIVLIHIQRSESNGHLKVRENKIWNFDPCFCKKFQINSNLKSMNGKI